MSEYTPTKNKFQLEIRVTEQPKKVLETIYCCDCQQPRELDGYRFKLMPICADCRTELDLEVLQHQINRRAKR